MSSKPTAKEETMGKSNTIQQQTNLNAEFQDYINTQTANLDKMTQEAQTVIDATIEKFYKAGKWTDAAPLAQGSYQHLTTASEWSLDNVNKIIEALKNSIFGSTPAPAGSTVVEQATDLAKNIAQMSEMTLLITSAAFNAIQGIMASFTTGTQTSVQKDFATKTLAPGLTLFLCVIDNQYHKSEFLSDNTILQTGYIFETRFSIQQAGDIANFNQVQALIAEQGASQALLAKFDTALTKLDVDDDFDVKYAKYNASMEMLNTQVSTLHKQIDDLRQKRIGALVQKRSEILKKLSSTVSSNPVSLHTDAEMAVIHKLGLGSAVKVGAAFSSGALSLTAVTYLTGKLIDKFPQGTRPSKITVTAIPPKVEIEYENTKLLRALIGTDVYESTVDSALKRATLDPASDLNGRVWTMSEVQVSSSY
jgi:hypothetical protein